MIQRHLDRSRKADPPNKVNIFAKLCDGRSNTLSFTLSERRLRIKGAY